MASNQEAIRSVSAAASFTLESPELEAIQKFRRGSIRFRRPSDLFVIGRHRVTNQAVFKLWSVGDQFLLEVPLRKRQNYYKLEGEKFESVPFSVSPVDIVREMFLPEDWSALGRRDVRIVAHTGEGGSRRIEIGPKPRPRRWVDVGRFGIENPAWVVVRNELLDDSGRTIAVTTMDEYILVDGVRFPARVEAVFPIEETRMLLNFRNVRINKDIPDDTFDIEKRARELGLL